LAAGFAEDRDGCYALEASAAAWEHLNECRAAVAAQLSRLPRPAAAPVAAAVAPPAPFPGAFGGMGGAPLGMPFGGLGMGMGGGMGGMDPSAMMQQLAANPQMMQQVSAHPQPLPVSLGVRFARNGCRMP
jgi:hypothetical protein